MADKKETTTIDLDTVLAMMSRYAQLCRRVTPDDSTRPTPPTDFAVWQSMRKRDLGFTDFPSEVRECHAARHRIDEWLVASMEKLMRDCEIAGVPFDKRERVAFSAGTGTGVTPGPEHSHMFTFDDYAAARSRVLAAKVAASDAARAEAARRVVLGPIDDEGEA